MFERYFDKHTQVQETVVRIMRPSPWRYRKNFAQAAGLFVATSVCIYPLSRLGGLGWLCLIIAYFCVIGVVARSILMWQLTACILTTHRCIDIDRPRLFVETMADLPLEHIQDVRYNKHGVLATVFDYGTVVIQSSQGRGRIELVDLPHPASTQDLIMKIHRQYTTDNHQLYVRE